ncbi:MRM1 methyltransferase, partial [Polypterus senegalus]|nr:MRM1 methyltransferase [Polypterus senegalus]
MRLVGNANLRRASSRIEVLFGVAPCFIALSRGRRVCHALYTKESRVQQRPGSQELPRRAAELGVPVRRVSKRELDKLSGGRVHQGYCLEVSPLKFTPLDLRTAEEEAHSDGCRLWLLLDRVQDPMNLGAILRSAYYFGLDRVVVGLHDSCPLSPVVSKASAGAMEDLDVYASETLPELIKVKIGQGWHVVGTVGSASEKISVPVIPCSEFQYSQPTVLILADLHGREQVGQAAATNDLSTVDHDRDGILDCHELKVLGMWEPGQHSSPLSVMKTKESDPRTHASRCYPSAYSHERTKNQAKRCSADGFQLDSFGM